VLKKITAILAGAAVVAAVALLPSAPAGADETPRGAQSAGYEKLPPIPKDAAKRAVPAKDLPRGAKRATHGPSTPGARPRAFQAPVSATRIVAGTPVNAIDHPGVVGIRVLYIGSENNDFFWYDGTCTGTVLSPTRVLTAAHCSIDLSYGYAEVIAGRNNLDDPNSGFVARVKSTWTHPGYNYEKLLTDPNAVPLDDITVLNLKDPLPAAYTPVTLAAQGAPDPAGGTAATIVGYGVTDEEQSDSGTLRAGAVAIASDATCASSAQHGSKFDPNRMMCAGSPPVDACLGDSGGPIFTGAANARVQVGITDFGDWDCGGAKLSVYEALNHYSALIRQQITQAGPDSLDWSGDGHADLFSRDPDFDGLIISTGTGLLFGTPLQQGDDYHAVGINFHGGIGAGNWNAFTKLFRVNNWSGDGKPSVFARDSAGALYNYRSNGAGEFSGGRVQIGSGWSGFNDILMVNDWIGNGLPSLIGRTPDGRLIIYHSDGRGGFSNPRGTEIGVGWNGFDTLISPGSWLGDGKQSLIGRNSAGQLWLYNSNGTGGWTNPSGTQIGSGWSGFLRFMSPGDFDGDNLVDMLGVRTNGDLMLYSTNGQGSWRNNGQGRVLAYSWNAYNMLF
jgi:hypothetical protein